MVDHVTLPPELNPRGPQAAPKPPRKPGGWRRPLGIIAAVVAVCVLAASGLLYTRYLHYNHNLHKAAGVLSAGGAKASGGAENVLLVGSDTRAGSGDSFAQAPTGQTQVAGQRSDTVILAHLAAGHQKATLVSLPRDSWVTIPAYTDAHGTSHPAHKDKLNAAFSLGGAPLLVSTVQQLTGIHIDHYAEIDFAGFQHMVDALGGVNVCLTRPAHDVQTGLNLTAGQHTLDGKTALEFVRQRYGLPMGDLDRIKRQQQFLASMMRKVESAGTLANPLKLNAFLDALTKSITVDSGMSAGDMTKLAMKLKGLSSGNVTLTTMPLSGFAKENGQDVDVVDTTKADALFSSFMHESGASASPSPAGAAASAVPAGQVHVQVFNGAGIQGLAARAASDLTKRGFHVDGTPSNKGSGATASVIYYGSGQQAAAQTLAAAVPGATLKADSSLGTDLQLVLGSSYQGTSPAGGAASASAGSSGSDVTSPAGTTTAANDTCTD